MRYVASRTRPIIYLPIAKSGLSSTLNAMYWLDAGEWLEDPLSVHKRAKSLFVTRYSDPEALAARLETDKVFVIVREPLRRAFSLFNEKAVHEHAHSFPRLRRKLRERGASLRATDDLERTRADFTIFLEFVQEEVRRFRKRPHKINPHWRPQWMFLRAAARERWPDFVCRTETLSDDFPTFLRWAGVDDVPPPRRLNEGPPAAHAFDDVARDDAIAELARKIFGQDYAMFGYPPPQGAAS